MIFGRDRSLLRVLEREREAFAAERARLIDQILHLSGKTWTPPPPRAPFEPVGAWDADPVEYDAVQEVET